MSDEGHIRADGAATPDQPVAIVPTEDKRPGRPAWINFGLGLVGVLVLVGVATAAVVAYQRAQFGPRMATAEGLPASTALYMSFDLEGLAEFDRLIDAFSDVTAEAGLDADTSVLDLLDRELLSEFGMSTADFEPWIGRDIGIGVVDLNFDDPGFLGDPGSVVVAASVRDQGEADAFMPQMVDAMEQLGMEFSQDSYQGVDLWVATVDAAEMGLAASPTLARSGDLMLLGSHRDAVTEAIDAQSGDALRDAEDFTRLVDQLPGDRAVTMYIGPELFRSFEGLANAVGGAGLGVDPGTGLTSPFTDFRGTAMSLTLADEGVRLDFAADAPPGSDAARAPETGSEAIVRRLPADTFLYFGIGPFDLAGVYDGIEEAMIQAGVDRDLAEFEAATGLDLERDVVDVLTGELGVGLVRTLTGPIAATGPPVGGVAMLGLEDPAAFIGTLERLNGLIAAGVGIPPDEEQTGDGVIFSIDTPDGPILYGVDGDYFVAGTERDLLTPGDGDGLVDAELFRETVDALDTGGPPLFYLDLGGALDVFEAPPDVRADLAPLRSIAAGVGSGDGITTATVFVLIDY